MTKRKIFLSIPLRKHKPEMMKYLIFSMQCVFRDDDVITVYDDGNFNISSSEIRSRSMQMISMADMVCMCCGWGDDELCRCDFLRALELRLPVDYASSYMVPVDSISDITLLKRLMTVAVETLERLEKKDDDGK